MGECSYFVGNVLVQIRHVFLPNYLLILSLLEHKVARYFGKKKSGPNRKNPLNSSINIENDFPFSTRFLCNSKIPSLMKSNFI